ncbi:hypothetical protein JRO89_XS02G0240600 [Xanthoceras sorbifolium]|uniref:Ribonuclease H1 N-terminal domain-containing protein n=1 Tax=Xanthoceras sorbifolium TaxID=99658 RepID=A0ABQ8IGV6_9ROSI|nr:hypothetical protein JRO89_XS02G0240600 [Xanthoceras sorbifolium]
MYHNWVETEAQVKGYPNNHHKSYSIEKAEEAYRNWLSEYSIGSASVHSADSSNSFCSIGSSRQSSNRCTMMALELMEAEREHVFVFEHFPSLLREVTGGVHIDDVYLMDIPLILV